MNEGKIFISTDWHMYRYDKNTGLISRRPDFEDIIGFQNSAVSDEDIFIFLGDLVDDQFTDASAVTEICSRMRGIKLFIRGNNDIFADDVYINGGFISVDYAIIMNKIAFSHTSIPVDETEYVNIHGHIHRDGWDCNDIPYYHPCNRNINICTKDCTTICLSDMDLDELMSRNNNWIPGKTEKPGMSMFVQNMAKKKFKDKIGGIQK